MAIIPVIIAGLVSFGAYLIGIKSGRATVFVGAVALGLAAALLATLLIMPHA